MWSSFTAEITSASKLEITTSMNRCFQSITLLVLPLVLICLSITASPAAQVKRVLLISSYHPAFPTFFQQTEGVLSLFAGHDILVDVEFMDSKRFMDDENFHRFFKTLRYKLEHLPPYDLILSADDTALSFLLAHKGELFANQPAVFFGVNNIDIALAQNDNPEITGVVEAVSMRETLELMQQLRPKAKVFTALVDGTDSGQGDLKTFFDQATLFPDHRFHALSLQDYSFAEYAEQLQKIDEDQAVLLLSAYVDRTGARMDFTTSLETILPHLSQPLFHLWHHGLGQGLIGGKVISHFEQGRVAAEMALKIFAGTKIAEMPVVAESPNQIIFDYPVLQRFGMENHPVVARAKLLNQPYSFYRTYRNIIWGTSAFFILQTAIILYLIISIRQRRRAEEQLGESEEKFRSAFDEDSIGRTLTGIDGRLLQVNPRFCKMLGYTAREITALGFADITHQDDVASSQEVVRRLLAGEQKSCRLEKRYLHKDGRYLWVEMTTTLLRDEQARPKYFITGILDISERKRASETLRESEANHKLVLAMMKESLSVIDIDGNFLLANATAARNLIGGKAEELIGKNICQIVPEEQSSKLLTAYRQVLDSGEPLVQEVLVSLVQGGRWFFNRLQPLEYGEQKIKAVLSISLDISDRKKAEEALIRQKFLLEKSQQMGRIGTWELDLTQNRLVWTDENCRIFGVPEGSVVTYEIFQEKVHPEDRELVHQQWQAALSGNAYDIEHRIVLGDQIKWVREKAEIHFDGDNRPIFAIGFTQEITERKRAEEEKKILNTQLQQAQKLEAIGTLAGGIAHDFNNILGAIVGYSEMIRDDFSPGSPSIHDINQVLKASYRAKDLVKQILAFSRHVEDQKITVHPAVIVKEAITLLRSSLPATIAIEQDIDKDAGSILADPTKIHQIVMNLATNAFHAMEHKGGTLTISLQKKIFSQDNPASQTELKPGSFVQLSIRDTGVGVAPEILTRIFDPFFTTKEVGKGTGLGLSMVYSIVKSCDGSIVCDSKVGEGTEFRILFPALEGHVVQENGLTDLISHGKEHILFIDDEKMLAELGQSMLERLGYQVTTTTSSLDALTIFQNQPDDFDLIITDQTMLGMTGLDLARQILQIRPKMPIILCTGYSTLISEDKAKSAWIKGFAYKPLTKKEIGELIRKVLDEDNP